MGWRSASVLTEEETPFGVWNRADLERQSRARIGHLSTRNAEIRSRFRAGWTLAALVQEYGLSRSGIRKIIREEST